MRGKHSCGADGLTGSGTPSRLILGPLTSSKDICCPVCKDLPLRCNKMSIPTREPFFFLSLLLLPLLLLPLVLDMMSDGWFSFRIWMECGF